MEGPTPMEPTAMKATFIYLHPLEPYGQHVDMERCGSIPRLNIK